MTRVNLLLALAVLGSAIYLVGVQYESRRLFTELEQVQREARRLNTELERLQVDKRSQATPARIERVAQEKLQMRQVTHGITVYISASDTAQAKP
jgi:cell division protein FtsL